MFSLSGYWQGKSLVSRVAGEPGELCDGRATMGEPESWRDNKTHELELLRVPEHTLAYSGHQRFSLPVPKENL